MSISRYTDVMREVARSTTPDEHSVNRTRARLTGALTPTTGLLAHLPEPSPFVIERLRRRLRGPKLARSSRHWLVAGGVALAVSATAAWITRPPPALPAPTSPLELVLSAPGGARLEASKLLGLDYAGSGRLVGEDPNWHLSWESGWVDVAVRPNEGADVLVETRDAIVRVVGTSFRVSRDELGTAVSVSAGRVEVDCHGGEKHILMAGETHECWPASPAGLLGRANALADQGADPTLRLRALERGLARAANDDDALPELRYRHVETLVSTGDHVRALKAAEQSLLEGVTHSENTRRIAARLALVLHGCDRARSHLAALTTPTPEEQQASERCGQPAP